MERRWVTSPSYAAALSVLVRARMDANLTQRQLAERLQVPRSFVSKVETRERRLDFVEFVEWAQGVGADAPALMAEVARIIGETRT